MNMYQEMKCKSCVLKLNLCRLQLLHVWRNGCYVPRTGMSHEEQDTSNRRGDYAWRAAVQQLIPFYLFR